MRVSGLFCSIGKFSLWNKKALRALCTQMREEII